MPVFTTRTRTLKELATAVRDARTAAGMTQTELATAAGLKRSWVSLFEGEHLPNASLARIFAMCDVLDITVRVSYPVPDDDDAATVRPRADRVSSGPTPDPSTPDGPMADDPAPLDPAALAAARAMRAVHRARAEADDRAGTEAGKLPWGIRHG